MKLTAHFTARFKKDYKRLSKKHYDMALLKGVIDLILQNTEMSKAELRRRHRMHSLKGNWAGAQECHVANAGDWLLAWQVAGEEAILLRTGSYDEIFS